MASSRASSIRAPSASTTWCIEADAFEAALEAAEDQLDGIARVYRQFAKAHTHLYRLMTERELHRELLTPGVEERVGLPVYEAVGRDVDLARAAWAFAHGMTILELNQRFPPGADLEAAWERGLDAFRPRRNGRRSSR